MEQVRIFLQLGCHFQDHVVAVDLRENTGSPVAMADGIINRRIDQRWRDIEAWEHGRNRWSD